MEEITLKNDTTEKVVNYIKTSWVKSIRDANDFVPYPFTSPSITGFFTQFFYWDNYFIHKGLLLDGLDYQVEFNLKNFAYYINTYGYMPNASVAVTRTQPPLFTKCVYEYYLFKKDKAVLKEYLPTILKEYDFWMTKRILPCGLNTYLHCATKYQILEFYKTFAERVGEFRETEEEQISVGEDIYALAESGLDFNPRFTTDESKIDSKKFIHLDINCIMYDVEKTIAVMYRELDDEENAVKFDGYAQKRKELIEKYLYDKEKGIYLDYNFVSGEFSKIVSAVSLYPYVYGISTDAVGAKKILDILELPYGITPCAFRGEDAYYFQWDYPCVWPYTTWYAYTALNNVGLTKDAERIAKKYMYDVNINFDKTGMIWEKYDGRDASVAVTTEYETPEMLGWSAGVYRVFYEEIIKK